jgi:ABC-type transport system substrate-binding protein
MNLAVQGYLSKVGIKVKITDWRANGPEQERLWRAGRLHDMMYWNWGSYNVFDADALLYTWLHSSSAGSYCNTPEMDKLQDDARATMDPVKRQKMYEKLQEWVVDNAIMMPSHARYGIYGVNKKLNWEAVGDEVPRWYSASWEK